MPLLFQNWAGTLYTAVYAKKFLLLCSDLIQLLINMDLLLFILHLIIYILVLHNST